MNKLNEIAQTLLTPSEFDSLSVYKECANIIINFLLPICKSGGNPFIIDPKKIAGLAILRSKNLISAQVVKEICVKLFEEDNGRDILQIITEDKLVSDNDANDLEATLRVVLDSESNAVADYKSGKMAAIGRLMGSSMKALPKGSDAKEVKLILEKLLKEVPCQLQPQPTNI